MAFPGHAISRLRSRWSLLRWRSVARIGDRVTPLRVPIPAGRFADRLVAHDLPALDDRRRSQALAFIESRLSVLPGPMAVGVGAVAAAVGAFGAVAGRDRTVRLLTRVPLPVVRDYVRLIRSLALAYVWETWPATATDGRAGPTSEVAE